MKLVIMQALWFLCSALTVYGAPTNQELFLQANAAYSAHTYEKALELYTAIAHKGPVTWYNMGNCAYQLQRHSDAYVYWKKSERGASWVLLQDAEHNLRLLKGNSSKETTSTYERIQQSMHMYRMWSSLWWLQLIGACIWTIFWLFYIRRASRVLQGALLLLICCCGIALKGKYTDTVTTVGVVVRAQAPLYAGPDTQFHSITTLDEMAEVVIMHSSANNDWYKISYKDQKGWMPADNVNLV